MLNNPTQLLSEADETVHQQSPHGRARKSISLDERMIISTSQYSVYIFLLKYTGTKNITVPFTPSELYIIAASRGDFTMPRS
jgi:hypothetical protein